MEYLKNPPLVMPKHLLGNGMYVTAFDDRRPSLSLPKITLNLACKIFYLRNRFMFPRNLCLFHRRPYSFREYIRGPNVWAKEVR